MKYLSKPSRLEIPLGPKNRIVRHHTDVPDWVCEILSTSPRRRGPGFKREVYANQGMGYL